MQDMSPVARAELRREMRFAEAQLHSFRLGDLLTAIRRHMLLVVILSAAGAGGGWLLGQRVVPRYAAESVLLTDATLSGLVDAGTDRGMTVADPAATTTIVESITTSAVLDRTLALLSPAAIESLAQRADLAAKTALAPDAATAEAMRLPLLREALNEDLRVDNSGRSYLVLVGFRSTDPAVAAEVPNALARAYLDYRGDLKRSASRVMLDSIDSDLVGLRRRLSEAERTAQEMRERLRIAAAQNEALTGRQQQEALVASADLFASQREAERDALATGAVYERMLLQQRELQRDLQTPEVNVQLFSPAVVPLTPSGLNIKPILLMLGLIGGFFVGAAFAAWSERRRSEPRRRREA